MAIRSMVAALAVVGALAGAPGAAQAQARVEYIDVRWDGVDKLCVVYPDGRVEFLGEELKAIPRPDRVNARAYYMTIAVGKMAARGYEIVAAFQDEIIMKKALP